MELKGYLTNLGKYNEGELVGEWVDFPLSDEEYDTAMKRIGAGEVPYEEIFWTDWDCDIEGLGSALGEYINVEEVNELVEKINDIDDDEKVEAIIEAYGIEELDDADDIEYIPYSNLGTFNRYDGLGQYLVENIYGDEFNLPKDTLERYFDYKSYGIDLNAGGDVDEETIDAAINEYPAFDTDESIGMYCVEEWDGGVENMDEDTLARYFDFEAFGRDCAYDYHECENGFLSAI